VKSPIAASDDDDDDNNKIRLTSCAQYSSKYCLEKQKSRRSVDAWWGEE
jgi:hypothetical protein